MSQIFSLGYRGNFWQGMSGARSRQPRRLSSGYFSMFSASIFMHTTLCAFFYFFAQQNKTAFIFILFAKRTGPAQERAAKWLTLYVIPWPSPISCHSTCLALWFSFLLFLCPHVANPRRIRWTNVVILSQRTLYSLAGLSLNILALLPMLVTHFDDLNEISVTVATNIAKVSILVSSWFDKLHVEI